MRQIYASPNAGTFKRGDDFALRPDQLIEIPMAAVTDTRVEGLWVRLTFRHETGPMTLYLKQWERRLRRIVIEPVLRLSPQELREALLS